jgi:hypothetical protein
MIAIEMAIIELDGNKKNLNWLLPMNKMVKKAKKE